MTSRRPSALLLAWSLAACVTPGAAAHPTAQNPEVLPIGRAPRIAAADLVRCKQLGKVEGVGAGGWGATPEMQEYWARTDAVALAEKYGATHVALVSQRDDMTRMTVEGLAYECP